MKLNQKKEEFLIDNWKWEIITSRDSEKINKVVNFMFKIYFHSVHANFETLTKMLYRKAYDYIPHGSFKKKRLITPYVYKSSIKNKANTVMKVFLTVEQNDDEPLEALDENIKKIITDFTMNVSLLLQHLTCQGSVSCCLNTLSL